jgi:DNA-binding NarL/FixJ family response regulator
MIRILIVEDHLMVRAGIRALLEKAGDLYILGEASDGQEAVELAEKLKPDVVVMDIMMPRQNGIQAAARIRELKLPSQVILLSMYAEEALVYQALHSGVRGYVLKSAVSEELILAIRAVARNETYLGGPVSSILIESALNPHKAAKPNDPLSILSPREREIMQLIAEEHTSSEIAEILMISDRTVEKHRANLVEKLKVRNVAGLVRLAVKYGLIDKEN